MRNLQEAIDQAHRAAGLAPVRAFETTQTFPEDGGDSVVQHHQQEIKKKAHDEAIVRQFKFAMQMVLSVADTVYSIKRTQRP